MKNRNPLMKLWRLWRDEPAEPQREHAEDLLFSLLIMAWFVEARDPYTGGHLWRVSRYAQLLAASAGLPASEQAQIALGGFLHDLGKIAVPDAILRKAGRLTVDEYAVIQTHPQTGFRLLSGHPLLSLVGDAILLHHERPDGKGYPHGLNAEDLPMMARIVSICDAFDAMTSHRPYRQGMPKEQALTIIQDMAGTQFDTRLSKFFVSLGQTGQLDHVIGHSDDGIPLHVCPMCGPTIVVQSTTEAGEHLYCRNCTGEFVVESTNHHLSATPTGRQGTAAQLEPPLDRALISSIVVDAIGNIEHESLFAAIQQSKQAKQASSQVSISATPNQ